MTTKPRVGVILMTYGSPATLDDIPVYLKHVYGGRDASEEVIAEFRRRYSLIGGSPLLRITREQAATWAIGYHLFSFIPITLIGAYYFTRLGVTLRDLQPVADSQ